MKTITATDNWQRLAGQSEPAAGGVYSSVIRCDSTSRWRARSKPFSCITMAIILWLGALGLASADDRMILSARGSVTSDDIKGVDFDRYEVAITYPLPWRWDWTSWSLSTQLLGSAGAVKGGDDTAFVGTIGAGLMVSWPNLPVTVDVGVSPSYISEDIYDDIADIGGNFHFTSHIAIRGWIGDQFAIGYRFQHMSNASIESPNPGVDSHMLELGYRF